MFITNTIILVVLYQKILHFDLNMTLMEKTAYHYLWHNLQSIIETMVYQMYARILSVLQCICVM